MLYLDSDFRVHVQQNESGTLTAWEDVDGIFAGKCKAFIEGHRIVPEGSTWTRESGKVFSGFMIAPAESPAALLSAQAEADSQTIAALDAEVVDLTYQNILLEMEV